MLKEDLGSLNLRLHKAMKPVSDPLMLGVEEQIGMLRLAAISALVQDDTAALEEFYEQSFE